MKRKIKIRDDQNFERTEADVAQYRAEGDGHKTQ